MKATFDEQDYMLILDRDTQELEQLYQKQTLETPLTQPFDGEDLGKIVSLALSENNVIDGIQLKYLPDKAQNWETILRIEIKINERAYNHIKQRGQFGTRYDSLGNKIDIFNGMPRF